MDLREKDYKRPLAIFGNGIENEQTAAAAVLGQYDLPNGVMIVFCRRIPI